MVMSGYSSFPLPLSPIHLHNEMSLLEMLNPLLYITAPVWTLQCSRLPGIDVIFYFFRLAFKMSSFAHL